MTSAETLPVRIAMWSGPRNISTAMMRAFENRGDCAVSDEPFYAAYLAATGLFHPMRDAVIASQPNDWRDIADSLVGPAPGGKPIWYQKHMTHHMVEGFGRDWIEACVNVFLIRAPEAVLASYARKRDDFTLEEIGLPAQVDLFNRAADRLGRAPPVIEGQDVLADPEGMLRALCRACAIPFDPAMLSWPAGRRAERRGLGAGLVRRGREVDRLRAAPKGGGLRRSRRRAEADRRGCAARSTRPWRPSGCSQTPS